MFKKVNSICLLSSCTGAGICKDIRCSGGTLQGYVFVGISQYALGRVLRQMPFQSFRMVSHMHWQVINWVDGARMAWDIIQCVWDGTCAKLVWYMQLPAQMQRILYIDSVADSHISSTPCGSQQIVLNTLILWWNAFTHYFPHCNEYIWWGPLDITVKRRSNSFDSRARLPSTMSRTARL